jgi:hypothetical protein
MGLSDQCHVVKDYLPNSIDNATRYKPLILNRNRTFNVQLQYVIGNDTMEGMSEDRSPVACLEPGGSPAEPTPEMIEAGAAELSDFVLSDVGPEFRKELAASVYEAMEAARAKDSLKL